MKRVAIPFRRQGERARRNSELRIFNDFMDGMELDRIIKMERVSAKIIKRIVLLRLYRIREYDRRKWDMRVECPVSWKEFLPYFKKSAEALFELIVRK